VPQAEGPASRVSFVRLLPGTGSRRDRLDLRGITRRREKRPPSVTGDGRFPRWMRRDASRTAGRGPLVELPSLFTPRL
jgi:hypothetical protein